VKYLERYTYSDYAQWKGRWELYDGAPISLSPSPVIKHQLIVGNIMRELTTSTDNCDTCMALYGVDWKISETTVVRPDVVLICKELGTQYITKAPKIIAEVISPSTVQRDERYKFQLYEAEKVLYYILVYPDDCKAKVYKLMEGKYSKEGDFFTGNYYFSKTDCPARINVDNVFRRFRAS
jgi:Uma2 family endonuclease